MPRKKRTAAQHRLDLAIDDLNTAVIKRDKTVARYLLDTEIAEAVLALDAEGAIDEMLKVDLLFACGRARQVLER